MNFQFEALGPTLRIVVLVFLLIFALLILGFIVFIAILPGKIAKARSHPQADAIAVCGWVGLPQDPIDGVSMAASFIDAKAPENKHVQYFDNNGSDGIYKDGWYACTSGR
jgi:hypothetical protein